MTNLKKINDDGAMIFRLWSFVKSYWLIILAWLATAFYIGWIYGFRHEDFHLLKTMELNAVGDFFAGVFGPLSFLWLVVGYIQQQQEIAANTKEIKESVDQQRQLVIATNAQTQTNKDLLDFERYKAKRDKQPSFSITISRCTVRSGPNRRQFDIQMINDGAPAREVKIQLDPSIHNLREPNYQYFEQGKTALLQWNTDDSGEPPQNLKLIINCEDVSTNPHRTTFLFELVNGSEYKQLDKRVDF